jgi:hypothetical protein
MYYYAMCGQCPAKANWYRQSTDREEVEEWAHRHTSTFGHGVTLGKSERPFDPKGK